ncbi:MAG TPA: hypothetical protein PK857_00565 [Hyphomicrobium sp.]|nr:hypothetical protein [Hyphomicrobium sp.]HRO48767.1 hypothetical protein [Hyphomicrobium sp.]
MAEKDNDFVEYRVLKPVFVNDTYVDPAVPHPLGGKRRKDGHVYVMAPRGLETKGTLELTRVGKAETPAPSPQGGGTSNPAGSSPQGGDSSGGTTGK